MTHERQRVGALILCGIFLFGCARSGPQDPNVITIAVFTSPNSFDPRIGTDEVSQKVYQLVYDNLFNLDEQLRVGPGLATRWEQPDERT
jgi:ABC-type transport system substrate-binding protein